VESISEAVEEIQTQFGQEASNRAMSLILKASLSELTSESLTGAVKEAMQPILDEVSTAEGSYASALQAKLDGFHSFLNGDEEDSSFSLSEILNEIFPGEASGEASVAKSFNSSFDWVSLLDDDTSSSENVTSSGGTLSIKASEIGGKIEDQIAKSSTNSVESSLALYEEALGNIVDVEA
jgi:hypothetical protein